MATKLSVPTTGNRAPRAKAVGCMVSALWLLLAATAALLGLSFASIGSPGVLALMSAWFFGSVVLAIALLARPARAVFGASAVLALVTSAFWAALIPSSTYIEEPITLALLAAAAMLFSGIGYVLPPTHP